MKKLFYTTVVIAIFAIGFAASGDSDEVRHENGRDYYKKIPKCHNCGKENPYHYYWEDKDGNRIYQNEGMTSNWFHGYWYCLDCLSDVDKIQNW